MGPLAGVKVIELAGLGPGPLAGMLLGDMGADVLRIERPGQDAAVPRNRDVTLRGRRTIVLDLKQATHRIHALELIARADALIEGFRPGVAEKLGLGPGDCSTVCPRLVYGRATGWGQDGPLALTAGHDINYIALSGVLHAIGRAEQPPTPPLNLVGDYGGGALYLALGITAALYEARGSGLGQVVDAAMVDGAASLMAKFCSNLAAGQTSLVRGTNILDSGAPFYDVYQCSDREWVAVGAIEPQFHAALLSGLEINPSMHPSQWDRRRWLDAKRVIAERFRSRTRAEWVSRFEGTDACVTPVLSVPEALSHPHNRNRAVFFELDGVIQPAPAPRFSRTGNGRPHQWAGEPESIAEVLATWGHNATGTSPQQPRDQQEGLHD